jgi:hypothetical protein
MNETVATYISYMSHSYTYMRIYDFFSTKTTNNNQQ